MRTGGKVCVHCYHRDGNNDVIGAPSRPNEDETRDTIDQQSTEAPGTAHDQCVTAGEAPEHYYDFPGESDTSDTDALQIKDEMDDTTQQTQATPDYDHDTARVRSTSAMPVRTGRLSMPAATSTSQGSTSTMLTGPGRAEW